MSKSSQEIKPARLQSKMFHQHMTCGLSFDIERILFFVLEGSKIHWKDSWPESRKPKFGPAVNLVGYHPSQNPSFPIYKMAVWIR
jgi:hypothetical protein